MNKKIVFISLLALLAADVLAQVEVRTEAQATASDGEYTPLWLNANKYGLSSLDKVNGYVRAGVFRSLQQDSAREWRLGYGADVAVAEGFTSTFVVQQAFGELEWKIGRLTIGSKEQPMELKNQELSTGSQTLGINARPVPSVRLSIPDYWAIPGTKGWLSLKGHISYGITTDYGWQKDFTHYEHSYTEDTKLHTNAGYLKIGKAKRPISLELGLEMACQYGGMTYHQTYSQTVGVIKMDHADGLKAALHAFIPGGTDVMDDEYENAGGNHLGSMMGRLNVDYSSWGLSAYVDHFFEDQSQMFLIDYDGYGSGNEWDKRKDSRWMVYDLKDMLLGIELRLKNSRWVSNIVAEYIYTKYQSGPNYHDHTRFLSDHIGGTDDYYNHSVFTGWQHWGQVMGNPLYRSPLYNSEGLIMVKDNRFWAWHLAACGNPLPQLHYRLMCTWQRGFGTYALPLLDPQRNTSLLAETTYSFGEKSKLAGWSVKGAIGMDNGSLLGDNIGAQLTIGKRFVVGKK